MLILVVTSLKGRKLNCNSNRAGKTAIALYKYISLNTNTSHRNQNIFLVTTCTKADPSQEMETLLHS